MCCARRWADGPLQEFRWVRQLSYEDSEKRVWQLNALECTETAADGSQQYFAWLTPLPVGPRTVEEIAQKGGRDRWKVENEGFNRQKNSGLNLEHVYSIDPEKWKAYYVLLQIAFVLVQLLERGSLLRRLAEEAGRPVWKLFGSLKNVARRLLESVRYVRWEEAWFDPRQAGRLHISLDSSLTRGAIRFSGSASSEGRWAQTSAAQRPVRVRAREGLVKQSSCARPPVGRTIPRGCMPPLLLACCSPCW